MLCAEYIGGGGGRGHRQGRRAEGTEPLPVWRIDRLPAPTPFRAGHLFMTSALRGASFLAGDRGSARTCNPQLRRLMLYPGQRRGRMPPFKRHSWPLTTLRAGVMFSQRLARKALLSGCVLAGALQPDVTSALTLPQR